MQQRHDSGLFWLCCGLIVALMVLLWIVGALLDL